MGYLAYLIAGGVIMSQGGSFIMLGLMYPYIFPGMADIWTILLYVGIVSIILGGIFLIIGLQKRSHRYDDLS